MSYIFLNWIFYFSYLLIDYYIVDSSFSLWIHYLLFLQPIFLFNSFLFFNHRFTFNCWCAEIGMFWIFNSFLNSIFYPLLEWKVFSLCNLLSIELYFYLLFNLFSISYFYDVFLVNYSLLSLAFLCLILISNNFGLVKKASIARFPLIFPLKCSVWLLLNWLYL